MPGPGDTSSKRRQWSKPRADLSLRELVSAEAPSSCAASSGNPTLDPRAGEEAVFTARRPPPFAAPALACSRRAGRNRPDAQDTLESGFTTYLSGANEERVRDQRRREAARRPAAGPPHSPLSRRNWGSDRPETIYLRAEDGTSLPITPPARQVPCGSNTVATADPGSNMRPECPASPPYAETAGFLHPGRHQLETGAIQHSVTDRQIHVDAAAHDGSWPSQQACQEASMQDPASYLEDDAVVLIGRDSMTGMPPSQIAAPPLAASAVEDSHHAACLATQSSDDVELPDMQLHEPSYLPSTNDAMPSACEDSATVGSAAGSKQAGQCSHQPRSSRALSSGRSLSSSAASVYSHADKEQRLPSPDLQPSASEYYDVESPHGQEALSASRMADEYQEDFEEYADTGSSMDAGPQLDPLSQVLVEQTPWQSSYAADNLDSAYGLTDQEVQVLRQSMTELRLGKPFAAAAGQEVTDEVLEEDLSLHSGGASADLAPPYTLHPPCSKAVRVMSAQPARRRQTSRLSSQLGAGLRPASARPAADGDADGLPDGEHLHDIRKAILAENAAAQARQATAMDRSSPPASSTVPVLPAADSFAPMLASAGPASNRMSTFTCDSARSLADQAKPMVARHPVRAADLPHAERMASAAAACSTVPATAPPTPGSHGLLAELTQRLGQLPPGKQAVLLQVLAKLERMQGRGGGADCLLASLTADDRHMDGIAPDTTISIGSPQAAGLVYDAIGRHPANKASRPAKPAQAAADAITRSEQPGSAAAGPALLTAKPPAAPARPLQELSDAELVAELRRRAVQRPGAVDQSMGHDAASAEGKLQEEARPQQLHYAQPCKGSHAMMRSSQAANEEGDANASVVYADGLAGARAPQPATDDTSQGGGAGEAGGPAGSSRRVGQLGMAALRERLGRRGIPRPRAVPQAIEEPPAASSSIPPWLTCSPTTGDTQVPLEATAVAGPSASRRPVSGRRAGRTSGSQPPDNPKVDISGPPRAGPTAAAPRPGNPMWGRAPGRRVHERRSVEESLDSLAHFRQIQAGRLRSSMASLASTATQQHPMDAMPSEISTSTWEHDSLLGHGSLPSARAYDQQPGNVVPASNTDASSYDWPASTMQVPAEDLPLTHGRGGDVIPCDDFARQLAGAALADEAGQVAGSDPAPVFTIPTTPAGQTLDLIILSTWGDPHYVGLSGIEIFDAYGQPLSISNPLTQVQADPASVMDVDADASDPRTPDHLVDGHAMTCDELHSWLAPFTPGQRHTVTIQLDAPARLGLVRIWNYNTSRVHSARGARHVQLLLDGAQIFAGEVRRAPGNLAEAPAHAECLLFTEDDIALDTIDAFDEMYLRAEADPAQRDDQGQASEEDPMALSSRRTTLDLITEDDDSQKAQPLCSTSERALAQGGSDPGMVWIGREIHLVVLETWGDEHFVGLTGLQVLGRDGRPLDLAAASICAEPRDCNDLPGCTSDDRTPHKLLDGVTTMDDGHMWLAPLCHLLPDVYNAGDCNTVTIGLGSKAELIGLRIHNYNKSSDDTQRGVKRMLVLIDGCDTSPPGGYLVRKAPGTADLDFGQDIIFPTDTPSSLEAIEEVHAWLSAMPQPAAALACLQEASKQPLRVHQEFAVPMLPCGFIIRLRILSSWGPDAHYLGLTGIQLHDAVRGPLPLRPNQVWAQPASVAQLPGMQADVRTADKLVDGVNGTSASHSWLAPVCETGNVVGIMLDVPIMLSVVRIWNYSKTPGRGARDIELSLDDQLIYQGTLRQAEVDCVHPQAILFTSASDVVDAEEPFVYSQAVQQVQQPAIVLINDRKLCSHQAAPSQTAMPHARPYTAVMVQS